MLTTNAMRTTNAMLPIDALLTTDARRLSVPQRLAGAIACAVSESAAWLGYGPGLLVCSVTILLLPLLWLGRLPHVNVGRFGLLIVGSLLVSRWWASKSRTEISLPQPVEELQDLAQERTRELQRNQPWLQEQDRLLDLAQDAILSKDQNGIVGSWSQGAGQMYGWNSQEAIGSPASRPGCGQRPMARRTLPRQPRWCATDGHEPLGASPRCGWDERRIV